MAFLNKSLSLTIYDYEAIYHGPILLAAFTLHSIIPPAIMFPYLAGLAFISTIFAINGLNKFFTGIATHISDPRTRHLREALVDTLLNLIDLGLKTLTAFVFSIQLISISGAVGAAVAATYTNYFSQLHKFYQTGIPLLFIHVHRFLLEGRARHISRFLSSPEVSCFVGGFFSILFLMQEQPVLMAFGSLTYFCIGLFMSLDVLHHSFMLRKTLNNRSPEIILGSPEGYLSKLAWRISLDFTHLISIISWGVMSYLSMQYFLLAIPSVLGITLPGVYSSLMLGDLISMGSKPFYSAAVTLFLVECARGYMSSRSNYDPYYLEKIHQKRISSINYDTTSTLLSSKASPKPASYATQSQKDESQKDESQTHHLETTPKA